MSNKHDQLLLAICDEIHLAERAAQEERKIELFGDRYIPEFLLNKNEKVRVEMWKENVSHNLPHVHVTHSDKFDASISLVDFTILAGKIDRKSHKHICRAMEPHKRDLLEIWDELNEKDNSVGVEKLINNLGLSIG